MKAIYKNISPIIENHRFKCGRSQGAWSYDVAQEQIKAQKDENALDRDWNTQEAEKARAFDMEKLANEQAFANSQRLASQEYQIEEWQRQFDVQNEYNDPVAQAERLRRAGINPQIAMSGDSAKVVTGSSVSAPSGSSPSPAPSPMASGHHGLSPVPFSPGTNLAQDLSQVAGALDSFGKAVGQGLENTVAAKSLQSMVDLKAAQSMGQSLINEGQRTANALSQIRLKSEDKMIAAKLTKLINEGLLAKSQGQHFDKLSLLDEAQTELVQTLNDKYGYEGQLAAMHVLTFMDQWRADMGLTQARTNEANAQAGLASAKAKTEDEIRDNMVRLEGFKGDLAGMEAFIKDKNLPAEWSARLAQLRRDKVISDKELQEGQLAIERVQQTVKARNESEAWKALDNLQHYLRHDMGYSAPNVGVLVP